MSTIDFFIDSLGPGGAERVASLLVNRWAQAGHDVRLITLSASGEDFHQVDERVVRASIGLVGPVRGHAHGTLLNLARVHRLRHMLRYRRPDAVVSFMTRMNVLVLTAAASAGHQGTLVVSERSNPDRHDVPGFVATGRRRLYPRASLVVAQTKGAAQAIHRDVPSAKLRVIPNPVGQLRPIARRDPRLVVAAGRLEHTKGFDILVEAFAKVRARVPGARLRIYGEGPEREPLETMIRTAELQDSVELPGGYRDVTSALGPAAVYVLSSRYEGFPNVLLEAMALSVPVVAHRCDHGPADIVDADRSGLLVDVGDVSALADAICSLLQDPVAANAIAAEGRRTATERFDLERIGRRWDHALALPP